MDQNVVIENSGSLTIEAGVSVNMLDHYIMVQDEESRLTIEGTAEQPVLLNASYGIDETIQVCHGSINVSHSFFLGHYQYEPGSLSAIQFGCEGDGIWSLGRGEISNSVFTGFGSAIYLSRANSAQSLNFHHTVFEDNVRAIGTLDGSANSNPLWTTENQNETISFYNSTFINNSYTIVHDTSSGLDVDISGSLFLGSNQIKSLNGVFLENCFDGRDPNIWPRRGFAFDHINGDAILINNTFIDSQINIGNMHGTLPEPHFMGEISNNSFLLFGEHSFIMPIEGDAEGVPVPLGSNWWGTTNTSQIEWIIEDDDDESTYHEAVFNPILTSMPNSPCETAGATIPWFQSPTSSSIDLDAEDDSYSSDQPLSSDSIHITDYEWEVIDASENSGVILIEGGFDSNDMTASQIVASRCNEDGLNCTDDPSFINLRLVLQVRDETNKLRINMAAWAEEHPQFGTIPPDASASIARWADCDPWVQTVFSTEDPSDWHRAIPETETMAMWTEIVVPISPCQKDDQNRATVVLTTFHTGTEDESDLTKIFLFSILDIAENFDTDNDSIIDSVDFDDDNDGWTDEEEDSCGTDPLDASSIPIDDNSNGFCDSIEGMDSDGDGWVDVNDSHPADSSEWNDSDGDGAGDNSDPFPTDPLEQVDSDGDGVGDNSDAFPNDSTEQADTDGDGVGDKSDAFPTDPTESLDSDKDGFGDNRDEYPYDNSEWDDSDGDGVGDNEDAFPDDPTETKDSDGDGIGDNSDSSPFPTTDGGMGKKIEDNFTIILLVLGLSIPLTAIALIMARKDSEEFQEDPIEEYYDEGQWSEKSRLIDTIEDLKRSGRGSFYVSDWADLGRMQLTSSGLPSIDTQPSERFSKEALEASNFDAMEQAASSTREALDWLMIHAVVSATESEEKLEQFRSLTKNRGIMSARETINYVRSSYGPSKRKGYYLEKKFGWDRKKRFFDEIMDCWAESSMGLHSGAQIGDGEPYTEEKSKRAALAAKKLIEELDLQQRYNLDRGYFERHR